MSRNRINTGGKTMRRKKIMLSILGLLFLALLISCGFKRQADNDAVEVATAEEVEASDEEEVTEVEADNEEEAEAEEPEETDDEMETPEEEAEQEEAADEPEETPEEAQEENLEEVEEEQSEPEVVTPTVEPAEGTYYVTAPSLNVRSGDGTSYGVLGVVTLNTSINVTGVTTNGWYEFSHNGNKGYVSGNYLSKEKKVVETTPPPAPKTEEKKPEPTPPPNNNNVVDNMTGLGNSRQVILVTTKGSSTTTGQFQTFEKDGTGKWNRLLQGTAYVGKTGMTSNKQEGDGKTPIGKFTLGTAFGYQGNPGTKLNFRNSTADDVWVDDSNSKYYNTWQQDSNPDKDWNSAESMMHRLYNYGIVINYNTGQTPGRGSAIFLHVGNSYTLGCVAVSQSNLVNIMKWVDPGKNPVIIQTPESGISNY